MNHLFILLQSQPAAGNNAGLMNILFIGGIILVFYFFMMRPQLKKQKEQQSFMKTLGKGDRVVTIGGIIGKVIDENDKTFLIDSEGTRLRVMRSAVSLENSRLLADGKLDPADDDDDDNKGKKSK